jgi:hypothetical protein
MTRPIWMALAPSPKGTQLLAMRGANETLLKGWLSREPASPRALQALLEAIALWEGTPLRAALVVNEAERGSATMLCHDVFHDFGRTPLYTLDWVIRTSARDRRGRAIDRDADFRDLARLLVEEVAR